MKKILSLYAVILLLNTSVFADRHTATVGSRTTALSLPDITVLDEGIMMDKSKDHCDIKLWKRQA